MGDEGVAAKIEVRGRLPHLNKKSTMQVYAFYDGGIVWNRDSVNQAARASLTSTGGGMRLYWGPHFFIDVTLSKPLTLPVSVKGNRHWRGFCQMSLHLW